MGQEAGALEVTDLLGELARLKKSLASLRGKRDFIVIDTAPRLGFELTTALFAADWYLIPVFASRYDTDGLGRLTQTVTKIRQRVNRHLQLLGVLLGNFDARTNLHAQILESLRGKVGEKTFETVIKHAVKHDEATHHRQTIFERAPGHNSANQFDELAKEVIDRVLASQSAAEAERVVSMPRRAVPNGDAQPRPAVGEVTGG